MSQTSAERAFCHVAGKPEADDKPARKTAREMIAMTAGINKTRFGGQGFGPVLRGLRPTDRKENPSAVLWGRCFNHGRSEKNCLIDKTHFSSSPLVNAAGLPPGPGEEAERQSENRGDQEFHCVF